MFHVPNKYRNSKHAHLATDDTAGNNGYFQIPHPKRGFSTAINCIASDGDGWEHVSVSVLVTGMEPQRVPDWSEMCFIKDTFWDEEDAVVQFHPPKSEYINMHNFVLHLWRRSGENFDTPPKIMVGV